MTQTRKSVDQHPVKRWGHGEWIGVLGIVIGIVVSLFTWWASEKTRNLSFRLVADRAEILKSGVSSDITAFYKGAEIKGDLIAYRFVVWNAGREPIRWPEDVLKDVTIQPVEGMKLLEAKIIRASREEIGFSVADGTVDRNHLILKWKILERGDGALIQLLATDARSPPFSVTGAVVGQESLEIASVEANARTTTLRKIFGDKNPQIFAFFSLMAFSLGVAFIASLATIRSIKRLAPNFTSWLAKSKMGRAVFIAWLLALYFVLCSVAMVLVLFPGDFSIPPSVLLGS